MAWGQISQGALKKRGLLLAVLGMEIVGIG
jgi:hypothetical protein